MKNLHILPTNKPSKLYKEDSVYKLDNLVYGTGNQNIYITSDEEIKVGDWYLWQGYGGEWFKEKCEYMLYEGKKTNHLSCNKKIQFKIILTTDLDLIKDGVQAIDDEFLEWFVNNPSCERVEVKEKQHFEADKSKRKNPLNGVYYSYKIIIPNEELKQSVKDYEQQGLEKYSNELEPKQTDEKGDSLTYWGEVEQTKQKTFTKTNNVDGQWLSPIPSERQWQEEKLVEIFEHYPNASPRWQYMNALIQIALEYKQDKSE